MASYYYFFRQDKPFLIITRNHLEACCIPLHACHIEHSPPLLATERPQRARDTLAPHEPLFPGLAGNCN